MSEKFLKPYCKWNYANMTKNANLQGGPEQYVQNIYNAGRLAERKQFLVISASAFAIWGIGKIAISKIKKYRKDSAEEKLEFEKDFEQFQECVVTPNTCYDEQLEGEENVYSCNNYN